MALCQKKDKPTLLYDRINDPLEQTNLVNDSEHRDIQGELDVRVLNHVAETGDDFDLEMHWPPKDLVSHKEVSILLKSEIYARAVTVP